MRGREEEVEEGSCCRGFWVWGEEYAHQLQRRWISEFVTDGDGEREREREGVDRECINVCVCVRSCLFVSWQLGGCVKREGSFCQLNMDLLSSGFLFGPGFFNWV